MTARAVVVVAAARLAPFEHWLAARAVAVVDRRAVVDVVAFMVDLDDVQRAEVEALAGVVSVRPAPRARF